MPFKPQTFMPGVARAARQAGQQAYEARRRQTDWRAWYKRPLWAHPTTGLRAQQLQRQPLCERCLELGRYTPATVVNHRKPHRGDWALFVDPANHESCCKWHHDSVIQSEERRGAAPGG